MRHVRSNFRLCMMLSMAMGSSFACIAPPPPLDPSEAADLSGTDAVWEAKTVDQLYARGEVRGFAFRQGDRELGRSYGRYVGPVDGQPQQFRFETKVELQLPNQPPVRSQGEVIVDAHGRLVRGFERTRIRNVDFERKQDGIVFTSAEDQRTIGYDPERTDAAFMGFSAILHEELAFAVRKLVPGPVAWRLLSLAGQPPVEWEGTVSRASDATRAAVVETNLGESIRLAEHRIRSIVVRDDKLEIEALDPAPSWPTWNIERVEPLSYVAPKAATFVIREIELPGAVSEPQLVGEVLVPKDPTGPLPGVVFIAGAGTHDRHGFTREPVADLGLHEITDALANAGFVVLRYDERGRGRSQAGPASFVGEIDDARRALRSLLVQPEVDPDRIVLVGHGEGGWRSLVLAAERKDSVVGVALLATPGRRYAAILREQAAVALQGLPPEVREEARAEQNALIDRLERGGEVPPELVEQARWIREIFAIDPEVLVRNVDASLLLVQGGKDFEVDAKADLRGLVGAAKKHRKQHSVRMYDDLDHLFKLEPDTSEPADYLRANRPVSARFLAELVTWMREVVQPPRRGR